MSSLLQFIAEQTSGTFYKSARYCVDAEVKIPSLSYDDPQDFTVQKDKFGETDTSLRTTKNLDQLARHIQQTESPLFTYFLDGSRRVYKVDDIAYQKRIFPIVGGHTAAVRLAAKHGIHDLSNYILYNFQDKPNELWMRLKKNADLCIELDVQIFSFPMKYIPLFGEEAKHREFTGKHWNRKFIRAIQSILNVTKGIVAPSKRGQKSSFFTEAFGVDLEEFNEILYMPEAYIVYRHLFRKAYGYTQIWETEYREIRLSEDWEVAQAIISASDFTAETIDSHQPSERVRSFLRHYTMAKSSADPSKDPKFLALKSKYDKLIKEDQSIELTLTYDFDEEYTNKRELADSNVKPDETWLGGLSDEKMTELVSWG